MAKRTLESRMAEWLSQPGAFVTDAEREFIRDMRKAATHGVGYGWMQQVVEWEWQGTSEYGHAWGPEYFEAKIRELEAKLKTKGE